MSKKRQPFDTDAMASELSGSAFFQPTSPQTGKTTSGLVDKPIKPQIEKYTTHLQPTTIKAVKRYALEHDLKDYEVVQAALDVYLAQPET